MSAVGRTWLPESALAEPALGEACDRAVAAWGERWFGSRAQNLVRGERYAADRRPTPGKTWQTLGEDIWLEWSEATRFNFARFALDYSGKDRDLAAPDRPLLLGLAERMAIELGEVLRGAFESRVSGFDTPSTPGTGAGASLSWAGPGGIRLELFIARPALAVLRKRLCRPYRSPNVAPARLAEIVGDREIEFEARLGTAGVTALDLRDLAFGDVVLVDRNPDERIELRRPAGTRNIAYASLAREPGGFTLTALRD